ncbi:MAG: hypothetical protein ACFIN4_00645 [Candidatus Walczuchella monophlebidarum]
MLRHIQVESNMSLTGANYDRRIPLKPSQVHHLLYEVYKAMPGDSNHYLAQKISKEIKIKGSKTRG